LIAEDDRDFGNILTQYVTISGFDVTLGRDGKEAWELFGKVKPDLCVLDVMMPEMDGFALCRAWKKDPDLAQKQLDELRQLTRGALGEMRTLLMELRPSAFRDADPRELFKHLTNAFSGRTGVPVDFEVDALPGCSLPVEVKNVFYRIAQEGLNNVLKHADASRVWFRFSCSDAEGVLTISDDGQGFSPEDVPAGHLGLEIMAERAEAIGAELTLASNPGEGTTLRLVWKQT